MPQLDPELQRIYILEKYYANKALFRKVLTNRKEPTSNIPFKRLNLVLDVDFTLMQGVIFYKQSGKKNHIPSIVENLKVNGIEYHKKTLDNDNAEILYIFRPFLRDFIA